MPKDIPKTYRSEKTREVSRIIRQYTRLAARVQREQDLLSDRATVLALTDREVPVQAGQLLLRCLDLRILGHPKPNDAPGAKGLVLGPDEFTVRMYDLEYWRRMAKDAEYARVMDEVNKKFVMVNDAADLLKERYGLAKEADAAVRSKLGRLAAERVEALEEGRQRGFDLDFFSPFVAWVVAVRSWLSPNHRERFAPSLPEVFYPFVDRMVSEGPPPPAKWLGPLKGDDATGLRIRTRLDIHREACLLMAEKLDRHRRGVLKAIEQIKSQETPRQVDAGKPVGRRGRRVRRPPLKGKIPKLTARQTEVVQIVGECKGNFSEAGRRLRLDRKTVKQHYDAAMQKMQAAGLRAPDRKLKPPVKQLPRDRRGQVDVYKDEDGQIRTGHAWRSSKG